MQLHVELLRPHHCECVAMNHGFDAEHLGRLKTSQGESKPPLLFLLIASKSVNNRQSKADGAATLQVRSLGSSAGRDRVSGQTGEVEQEQGASAHKPGNLVHKLRPLDDKSPAWMSSPPFLTGDA